MILGNGNIYFFCPLNQNFVHFNGLAKCTVDVSESVEQATAQRTDKVAGGSRLVQGPLVTVGITVGMA
jgi:hypothetical protein